MHALSQQIWKSANCVLCANYLDSYQVWYSSYWLSELTKYWPDVLQLVQFIVNIWSKVWQKSRFDRFQSKMVSRNRVRFCHILQHCQKICLPGINDHCSPLPRGKVCWAKDWNFALMYFLFFYFLFFFAASSVCCWGWSLIIPHSFNPLSKSFHDRNSDW